MDQRWNYWAQPNARQTTQVTTDRVGRGGEELISDQTGHSKKGAGLGRP